MFKKLAILFAFFDKKIKVKLIYFQLIIIFTSVVEILSIFSIGPLVQLLSNPNSIFEEGQMVYKIYNYFNFTSFESFILFIVIIIFILFFTSVIAVTYTTYLITIFAQNLGNDMRISLYRFYLSQPWLYHAKSNSSDFVNKIIAESGRVTNNIIFNILNTNSKLLTGIFIIIFLSIYNIKVSLISIISIGIMYLLIFSIVKSRIEKYGVDQSKFLQRLYKIMSDSFIGIKETIIYGKKKNYIDDFSISGKGWGLAVGKINFLVLSPRYLLEFLAFSIILFFVLVMVFFSENNFNETLPAISVYVFAGYKLLPIFQAIYQGIAQLKGNIHAIDKIEYELKESKKYSDDVDNNDIIKSLDFKEGDRFKFSNVSFSYQGKDKAINNINLDIKKNTLNFIVGASGTGKSTLLDLILGLIFPQTGKIEIGSNELSIKNCKSWYQNLGYVGQNIFLLDDTIKNNICFNDSYEKIDESRFQRALNLSYVDKFLDDMPDNVETIVGERGLKLSGGQRQRVAIARALYQDKKFLILDEATASLDGIAEKFIIDQLEELSNNITIIMVTHNVKLCKRADNIYLLQNGSIKKSGNYDDLMQVDLFRKLLNE